MENVIERDLIVVKVGTKTLTEQQNGREVLDYASFGRIGKQVVDLANEGYGIVLVSSGAIAAGIAETGIERSDDMEMVEKQRLAGIGWQYVVEAWRASMIGKTMGAMLLTRHELDESENTRREALATIDCHLRHGDIVLINENDAIAHDEIKFGCNDVLLGIMSARLAKTGLYKRVRQMQLTDTDGLYRDVKDSRTLIRVVDDIEAVKGFVTDIDNGVSKGGMTTKLKGAEIATAAGVETCIANGRAERAIKRALSGEIGTRFRINGQEEDTADLIEDYVLEAMDKLLRIGLGSADTVFNALQVSMCLDLSKNTVHQLARQKVISKSVDGRLDTVKTMSATDAVMAYIAKKDASVIESARDRKRVRQQVSSLLNVYFEADEIKGKI